MGGWGGVGGDVYERIGLEVVSHAIGEELVI